MFKLAVSQGRLIRNDSKALIMRIKLSNEGCMLVSPFRLIHCLSSYIIPIESANLNRHSA